MLKIIAKSDCYFLYKRILLITHGSASNVLLNIGLGSASFFNPNDGSASKKAKIN